MKTALFDFPCPPELIAQTPAARRDESRLLVVHRSTRALEHRRFRDLVEYLRPGDCLVRNSARVLPARLFARRSSSGDGQVECLLLRPHDDSASANAWWCLLRPGKKLPPGSTFGVPGEFSARVLEKSPGAEYLVAFTPHRAGESVVALAERLGEMPLPPYIRRGSLSKNARQASDKTTGSDTSKASATPSNAGHDDNDNAAVGALARLDRERYQTVFADPRRTVAAAAPTAGLHFTDELLERARATGASFADVVLHVGLGTFRPIECDDVEDHPIHRERIEIPAETRARLDATLPRAASGRRIAIGTTSVRTIEFYAREQQRARGENSPTTRAADAAFFGDADIFIHPPFQFRLTDALVTNFHLPRSTLLCLVSAFLTPGSTDGVAWLREIYAEAVRERYRFFSYGDAMLIL